MGSMYAAEQRGTPQNQVPQKKPLDLEEKMEETIDSSSLRLNIRARHCINELGILLWLIWDRPMQPESAIAPTRSTL
jgi:hypothetical protein